MRLFTDTGRVVVDAALARVDERLEGAKALNEFLPPEDLAWTAGFLSELLRSMVAEDEEAMA